MDKSKNKNTTKATATRMNVYHTWVKHRGEVLEIEKVEPKKLDQILRHFFMELKKQDGQDYELNSLCAMQASIDRYLCERGYTHSILKSGNLLPRKLFWKEKHKLFAKTEREGDQIKVVA